MSIKRTICKRLDTEGKGYVSVEDMGDSLIATSIIMVVTAMYIEGGRIVRFAPETTGIIAFTCMLVFMMVSLILICGILAFIYLTIDNTWSELKIYLELKNTEGEK